MFFAAFVVASRCMCVSSCIVQERLPLAREPFFFTYTSGFVPKLSLLLVSHQFDRVLSRRNVYPIKPIFHSFLVLNWCTDTDSNFIYLLTCRHISVWQADKLVDIALPINIVATLCLTEVSALICTAIFTHTTPPSARESPLIEINTDGRCPN